MTKHLLYEATDARAKMNCNRRTAMKRSVNTIWVGIEMSLRGWEWGLNRFYSGETLHLFCMAATVAFYGE